MTKRSVVLAAMVLFAASAAFAADPVEGYWKSVDEVTGEATAFWNIYQKDGLLYGAIVRIVGKSDDTVADKAKPAYKGFPVRGDVSKMLVIGTPWIYSLKQTGTGAWSGGYIVNPQDGKQYKCRIVFRAADGNRFAVDTLEMRGEIGLGIGRSQYWIRARESEFR